MRKVFSINSQCINPIVECCYDIHSCFLESETQPSTTAKQIYYFHLHKQFWVTNEIRIESSFWA